MNDQEFRHPLDVDQDPSLFVRNSKVKCFNVRADGKDTLVGVVVDRAYTAHVVFHQVGGCYDTFE